MTVSKLREMLAGMPPDADVFFAECDHHHIEVTGAAYHSFPHEPSFVELSSRGWTDDCKCDG